MTGDYFMNYDIDDIMEPWCIKERVEFLENNPDCGMVISNGWSVDDDDLENVHPMTHRSPIWQWLETQKEKEYVFKKRLLGKQGAMPVPYLFRTKSYLEANHNKALPNISYSQDEMLLLLNSFLYPCGYIANPSYRVVNTPNSLSKDMYNPRKKLQRIIDTLEAAYQSIDLLPISNLEKEKYKIVISRNYGGDIYGISDYENLMYVPSKVLLFGAGKIAGKVLNTLKKCNIEVDTIIDNNSARWGEYLNNVSISSLENVAEKTKEMAIVIAVKHSDSIKAQLTNFGLTEYVDYYDYRYFMKLCRYYLMRKLCLVDALSM